ncbi:hypothetical protein ACFQY5_34385 [Paeniroseomonas aquatica]|uniref:Uncharacterized protein n=1 Tax=Paeniroseomonas aquatica TaxID=373043 RepID=A0ABT7ZZD6_9PROT|nr:hypothetical protein [Paeniroseomonas aquatica]MDN3562832.1 hypothetical protein [Paeniroseomonas aquatica]
MKSDNKNDGSAPLPNSMLDDLNSSGCIATYRAFAKDHAKIFSELNDGIIYHISISWENTEFKIFNISIFDEEMDSNKSYLQISGRSMQDATLFFLQFARDTMTNLRITSTKNRSYLLEPRIESLGWTAKRFGLKNRTHLARIILGGGLQDILTSDFGSVKLKHRSRLKAEIKPASTYEKYNESEKLETDLANLRLKELAILQKLGRIPVLTSRSKDERIRWQDERIAQLRQFITENNLEIPGPATTQKLSYANRAKVRD